MKEIPVVVSTPPLEYDVVATSKVIQVTIPVTTYKVEVSITSRRLIVYLDGVEHSIPLLDIDADSDDHVAIVTNNVLDVTLKRLA